MSELEAVQKVLKKNSIFFCAGWFVLWVSLLGLLYFSSGGGFPLALVFIGWGIIGWPKIWIMIKGGGLKGAISPSYEVVTTYGDGSRSSDGGAESAMTNIFVLLFKIGLLYVIGTFIQAIHLIILTIRYMILHGKAQPKPAFIQSGMFIIVLNVAFLIGSPVLGGVIQKIGFAAHKAASDAKRAALGAKTVGDLQIIQNAAKTGIIIERYVGKGGDVVIPAQFDGLPVLIIGSDAFAGNDLNITSVVIPENITDIAGSAFRYNKLTSVTFPRSLQRVGSNAFENCTSLTDVRIPSGHTIIYGNYQSGVLGVSAPYSIIEDMVIYKDSETYNNFVHKQGTYEGSFRGCISLSAASQQALKDSGYTGEF